MILVDTSGLLAVFDRREPLHEQALAAVEQTAPPRLLSPFVLAELDHLLRRRAGPQAQLAALGEVATGALTLEPFATEDVDHSREIVHRHRDFGLSLADASVVVLAHRHRTRNVLTLDHQHFRVLPGPGGRPFRLLPADG